MPACANTKCEPPPADQIDSSGDLREVGGIAVGHRRDQRRQAYSAGHRGQRGEGCPTFHERLVRCTDPRNLNDMIHHGEPRKTVALSPLRPVLCRFKEFIGVRTEQP